MSSHIHILTSFLPLYFGGAAIALHTAGRFFGKRKIRVGSYWLFLVTSLSTTFTCGFGGASIRKVESIPGIDLLVLKTHAWTAMTVFLLSVALAFISFRVLHKKKESPRTDNLILLLSIFFMAIFLFTAIEAYKIR